MKILPILFLWTFLIGFAHGQFPIPDMDFSTNSEFYFPNLVHNSYAEKMIELESGEIIVGMNSSTTFAGQVDSAAFQFYKLDTDGNLDLTFGVNGFLRFDYVPNLDSRIFDMLSLDNQIIAIVMKGGQQQMLSFSQEGKINKEFGNQGMVNLSNGLYTLALTPSNAIIVGGMNFNNSKSSHLLHKYNSKGQLDDTFGENGVVKQHFDKYDYYFVKDIECSKDGSIYVVGEDFDTQPNTVGSITKYRQDGSIASNYGEQGRREIVLEEGHVRIHEMVLSDESVIAAGYQQYEGGSSPGNGTKPLLIKVDNSGDMDESFGEKGTLLFEVLNNGNDWFTNIELTPKGDILASGVTAKPFPDLFTRVFIRKISDTGEVYDSFGEQGVYMFNTFDHTVDWSKDMILVDSGHKLITSGYFENENYIDVAFLKRFIINETISAVKEATEDSFVIYPNPSSDIMLVKNYDDPFSYKIYTLHGQLLSDKENTRKIELHDLPSGMYIINVNAKRETKIIRRIVKE